MTFLFERLAMQRVMHWADGPMLGQLPHEMTLEEIEDGCVRVAAELPCGGFIHEYEVGYSMLIGGEQVLRHVASMRIGNRRLKQ
jgi:hypothetical protein